MPMRYLEAQGLTGLWVVTLFHFLPAIVIFPFIAQNYMLERQNRLVSLVSGGLMGCGFVLYSLGLIVGSVTKTTVLFYLTPIWATLLAYVVLSELVELRRWLALSGGLIGCLLVMRIDPFSFDYDYVDLFGLAAGVSWAMGSVVIRRFPDADFVHITFIQYFIGGLLAAATAILLGNPLPTLNSFVSAIPVALLASVVVFLPSVLLIFRIMQYLSPGLIGILMLSEVLVAALSAWLFLNETLDLLQWVGVLAILATGLILGLSEKSESA